MTNLVPGSDPNRFIPAPATPPVLNQAPAQEEDVIDLREILGVLRRNALLVLACTLAAAALTAYLVFSQLPQYRASAVIRLKDEREALTGSMENPALDQMLGKAVDPLLSQLEVMQSRTVAREVVQRTGFRVQPLDGSINRAELGPVAVDPAAPPDTIQLTFTAGQYQVSNGVQQQSARYGETVAIAGVMLTVPAHPGSDAATLAVLSEQRAVERLQRDLRAVPMEKTDVVTVDFTSVDPVLAKQVADTAVIVFQEANARDARQRSQRRRVFIEEQLAATDVLLIQAQQALSDFRRRESVLSSRDEFAAQQAGIFDLEVRLQELEADRSVYADLLENLNQPGTDEMRGLRSLVSAPGIAQNPVVAQLYTQLARYQTVRDSLTTGNWSSAPDNPDVQRINSLIASTQAALVDAARSHVGTLDARIAALEDLRRRTTAGMQAMPDKEAEEMRLVLGVETTRNMADLLREEYQRARIAEAVEVGVVEVVDHAILPTEPIGAGRGLKVALGAILGLMLGGGAAFLREHLNTAIRRNDEIEPLLHTPSLAVVPRIALNGNAANGGPRLRLPVRHSGNGVEKPLERLVTVNSAHSTGAEAFRNLRTNLIFANTGNVNRLLITSSMSGEGKSTTASNLAVAFAQQGVRVLLIDADLRKPTLYRIFGFSREPGLVEVLAGMEPLESCIRPTPVDGLSLITSGALPPNPSELLGGDRMREILDKAAQEFELVIVDAPPVLVAGDASILGAMCDGAVVVIRAGETHRDAARAAVKQLRTVGTRVLGAVLNDPDAKVPSYEGHYYAYSYYGEDGK